MHTRTLLIVAHGSRRQASNDEVRALASQVRAISPAGIHDVQVAFLELAEPSIPDALADCVSLGAQEIIVFPYFLAAGTHVATDIPEELTTFRNKYPNVQLTLTPHLGVAPALPRAILEMTARQEPLET